MQLEHKILSPKEEEKGKHPSYTSPVPAHAPQRRRKGREGGRSRRLICSIAFFSRIPPTHLPTLQLTLLLSLLGQFFHPGVIFTPRNEGHTCRIHTVPLPSGLRPIIKDMTQMSAALSVLLWER